MRLKRHKDYKRYMNMYCQTFHFRKPFQVLGEWHLKVDLGALCSQDAILSTSLLSVSDRKPWY